MNVNWIEVLNVLKIWSSNIIIYGFMTILVIALTLLIHTKMTKDTGCNMKLLRKILS